VVGPHRRSLHSSGCSTECSVTRLLLQRQAIEQGCNPADNARRYILSEPTCHTARRQQATAGLTSLSSLPGPTYLTRQPSTERYRCAGERIEASQAEGGGCCRAAMGLAAWADAFASYEPRASSAVRAELMMSTAAGKERKCGCLSALQQAIGRQQHERRRGHTTANA
jgi:hypothetical protein